MKYWIIAVSEENWYVIREKYVYGAPESKARSPKELISVGDILVFYVKKGGSRKLGGKFVGVFRVVSEWFKENKPLWPDEVREGRVKYPWRVRLEPLRLSVANFQELVPVLSFIRNKERAMAYLVGTPANLRRPLPEEDAKKIINALR